MNHKVPRKLYIIFLLTGSLMFVMRNFTQARTGVFVKESLNNATSRGYVLLAIRGPRISSTQCGILCTTSPFCSMFLYSTSSEQCALYGVTNTTPLAASINFSGSWTSYVYKSGCQYMYVRVLDKCWTITTAPNIMTLVQTECRRYGGELIQTPSVEEFQFLQGMLLYSGNLSSGKYWMGAQKSSSDFIWINSTKSINSAMWASTQPDNRGYPPDQSCVDAIAEFGFGLNDVDCLQVRTTICAIPMATPAVGR